MEYYGKRRVPQMIQKVNRLREKIRGSGDMELEAAWDEAEEFLDFLFQEAGARDRADPRDTQATAAAGDAKKVAEANT